ncbi:MAG: fumarate hydratase [Sphingobacteriaceae bacterium]|nr:fumarate hydratase [Sphingobacteriaceae bacterium]
MGKRFILFLVASVLFVACRFNPNYQGKGASSIQGQWEEVPPSYKNELLQYTQHQFRFTCDSFYVKLSTTAKNNVYVDSCFNNGYWEEYARGIYESRNDTLYLSGTFTKSNGKQKISGCYRIGQYLNTMVIDKAKGDTLTLKSMNQQNPIALKLIQSWECTPKPLN